MKKLIFIILLPIIISLPIGYYRSNVEDYYGRITTVYSPQWYGNKVNGHYSQMVIVSSNGTKKSVKLGCYTDKDNENFMTTKNIGDSVKVSVKNIDYDNITIIK